MAAPSIPTQFPFPKAGEQPITYPELLDKLRCICSGGAQIKASPPPGATFNIGDVIAQHAQYLSTFTSVYGMITVILRMIACIIEVLCALVNPFSVLAAIIKLFGTCLPDFILIFPQFAVPAIIICVLKIILAIIQYIMTVIIPVIMEIIHNVEMLVNAIKVHNADAIAAVVFKIVAMIKELYNIIGILSVLDVLFIMIKALLAMGIGIPCGGGSDSACCNDTVCPPFIRENTVIHGTDGTVYADVDLVSTPPSYKLRFGSPSNSASFLGIRDFFPPGLDYSKFQNIDQVPYYVDMAHTTYAATSVNNDATLNIERVPATSYNADGYLSTALSFSWFPETLGEQPDHATYTIRFGTKTKTFDSTFVGSYMQLQDKTSAANSGIWAITKVYDGYNVRLSKTGAWATADPKYAEFDPAPFVNWLAIPFGGPRTFDFHINHTELMRYGMIGVGCHPAVQASMAGLKNRFPDASDMVMPDLPDFPKLVSDCNACIAPIGPINVDSYYVLDNYATIAENAPQAAICLTNTLGAFQAQMGDYVKGIYPRIFSPEKSVFTADPLVELVGNKITATVVPYDIYGGKLASTLPPGIIDVQVLTDLGDLGPTTEILDAYGNSTGVFKAQITSPVALTANLTAKVADKFISYFDGYDLIPQSIAVRFVEPQIIGKRDEVSPEPLGKVSGGDA